MLARGIAQSAYINATLYQTLLWPPQTLSVQRSSLFRLLGRFVLVGRLFTTLFRNDPHLDVQSCRCSELRSCVSKVSQISSSSACSALTSIFLHRSPVAEVPSPQLRNVVPLGQSSATLHLRKHPELERPLILGEMVVIVQSTEV